MRILVVDNYDSFVFNLVQYLGQLNVDVEVWRNDDERLTDRDAVAAQFDGILLSPGPGTPQRAGATMDLVSAAARAKTPLLGVCLGHQAIGAVFGATVEKAPELLHGKTSLVHHSGVGVLEGMSDPFTATRYHSLTVRADTIPAELEVIGRTESGLVMAMRHTELPIHGVQFHPESILTEGGHRMLANWLAVCGMPTDAGLVAKLEAQVSEAFA
ncbi:aminodeoxychorismate/anthranilate synthase component II [Rhodococcus sp. 06-412-2C]|uniref:aminodeoxychorismate/anthranilate synthase component II n=1 Tax=unclassified Rhodococcus (in: high G+C Gram-positive bacteria) TaxID=192944 RepID=UPI000B9A356E|nr:MULTISPECIES: aminodeoxychorismate/anthranilate synthase component II [unclassified Rhodococcus (in: high G+C Gram-positive bacteria)]OZC88955.1 aminodeoxychorismate/anthranilate synthase component II [Rhodococcus sp. 06-412-2C]OZD03313.1 aminodeoxychorismate/anthranilate synthase component II [Rhodococcus sp. 06-412-2B]